MSTTYKVPSMSKERSGVSYAVTHKDDSTWHCTCENYRWHDGACKHILARQRMLITYEPMLAHTMPADFAPKPGQYVVEEKFDGHRLMVRVESGMLTAWSRLGKDSMKKLSADLQQELLRLPNCVVDGEIIVGGSQGGYSSDVARLENRAKLHFVLFDVLEIDGNQCIREPYVKRRELLTVLYTAVQKELTKVRLSVAFPVLRRQDIEETAERIWENRGEGIIIKSLSAPYEPGKRRRAFLKHKQCGTAVLEIIGWESGTTGPQNVAVLRDYKGITTKVKVLDDLTRARVAREHKEMIGRRLQIEFHERTPDGNYRHPRWDRFEDE